VRGDPLGLSCRVASLLSPHCFCVLHACYLPCRSIVTQLVAFRPLPAASCAPSRKVNMRGTLIPALPLIKQHERERSWSWWRHCTCECTAADDGAEHSRVRAVPPWLVGKGCSNHVALLALGGPWLGLAAVRKLLPDPLGSSDLGAIRLETTARWR
jgi:hypothetical protein